MPSARQKSSKSAIERKRTLGVLYQWKPCQRADPRRAALLGQLPPQLAIAEVGEADDAAAGRRGACRRARARTSSTACSVCERTTKSNWPSAKAARPWFRSAWTTSSPRRTQARIACSSSSTPIDAAVAALRAAAPTARPCRSRGPARSRRAGSARRSSRSRAGGGGRCSWGCGGGAVRRPSASSAAAGSLGRRGSPGTRRSARRSVGSSSGSRKASWPQSLSHVAVADRLVARRSGASTISCDWNGGKSQSLVKLTSSQRQCGRPQRLGQLLAACRPGRTGPWPSSA